MRGALLLFLSSLVLFLAPWPLGAQAHSSPRSAYPAGLAVAYGIGAYGVRDEAISTERYEGTLPYLAVSWTRDHERYVYRLGLDVRTSEEIRNYTVDSRITRFALGQAFLYPLATTDVMGREMAVFLGPTTEAFVFANEQHIAVDGLGFAQSVAALLSLGVRGEAVVTVSDRMVGVASLQTSVISLGIRAVDDEVDDESPAKLLFLPAAVNAAVEVGAMYRVVGSLSVRLGYLFQLGRITAWDPFVDASDSVVGALWWRF